LSVIDILLSLPIGRSWQLPSKKNSEERTVTF
jgi:hypothetical protein